MPNYAYVNFVNTTLAANLSSSATTLTLSSSANLPTLSDGEILALVLCDAATQTNFEIVTATAISGANCTIIRGQEGTAAQSWLSGDFVYAPATAAMLENLATDGVTSLNGQNMSVVLESAANTLAVTSPSSGVINLEVSSAHVATSVNGQTGPVVIESTDGSLSVTASGGDVNIEWSPPYRSYGGGATTNSSSRITVTVPYVIVGVSAIITQNTGGLNPYTAQYDQVLSNFANGVAVFYALAITSSPFLVGAGCGIQYTIVTNNTVAA